MPLMLYPIYDALLDADVNEEKARKAAEAVANLDHRAWGVKDEIAEMRRSIQQLHVLLGVNLTLTVLLLGKLFLFAPK
jgi:hypothetical protein